MKQFLTPAPIEVEVDTKEGKKILKSGPITKAFISKVEALSKMDTSDYTGVIDETEKFIDEFFGMPAGWTNENLDIMVTQPLFKYAMSEILVMVKGDKKEGNDPI